MNWVCMLLLLLIPLIASQSFGAESEVAEITTVKSDDVSNDTSSSPDEQVQLDSNLRNALLKALSELEGDDNNETQETQGLDSDEKNVEKAQATAVTYFANEDEQDKIEPSQVHQDHKQTLENQITTTLREISDNLPSNNESQGNSFESPENVSTEKASEVLVQKSNSIQSLPITAIEKEPADFFKDAEQIITSASNSFITQNGVGISSPTPRSIKNEKSNTKISSFSNLNTIEDSESKSLPNPVDEPPFLKTYIRPLGNNVNNEVTNVNNDVAYVKPTETYVKFLKSSNVGIYSKSSATSEVKGLDAGDLGAKTGGSNEGTTAASVEVSTEESEAKVEQVQFFSAPLVAAFTVHQDEKGQPKKVEPIFKNVLNPKKEEISVRQNLHQENTNLQSTTFNNLDLQKKQQILEQELEKLRNQQLLQQQNILLRSNTPNNQGFNNPGSNNLGFTQSSFNQAVKQNFNQFDPIFTEPDRSIVTKLATIDPNTLLSQNGGPFLNRFTPSDAILPLANPVKPSFTNKIVPDSKPSLKSPSKGGEVSLIPSISFDPIIEAGKLPLNAQVLPNKEPTGFLNFLPINQNLVTRSQIHNSVAPLANTNLVQSNPSTFHQGTSNLVQSNLNSLKPNSNFAQTNLNAFNSNLLAQPQNQNNPSLSQASSNLIPPNANFNTFNNNNNLGQSQQNLIRPSQNLPQPNQNFVQPGSNLIQPSIGNFVSSTSQSNSQALQNSNFLNSGQSQSNNFLSQGFGLTNDGRGQNLNQNNQFLTPNRILRQEQGIVNPGLNLNSFSIIPSQQPFNPKHEISYFSNNNRFLRQNQGVSLGPQQNFVGQNIPNSNFGFQDSQSNLFNGNQNRFFRSNLEGTATNPSFNIQQSVQPFGQQIFTNNPQTNRFFRSNQEGSLSSLQNFENSKNVDFGQSQIDNNNRFLRSNQESTFLGNQNRFLGQPTIQNYKYSSPFGFQSIPLN